MNYGRFVGAYFLVAVVSNVLFDLDHIIAFYLETASISFSYYEYATVQSGRFLHFNLYWIVFVVVLSSFIGWAFVFRLRGVKDSKD